jgi:hypothetical protein
MEDNMEIWKAIPGYEGYEASTLGKIRSLNYNKTGRIKELSLSKASNGYLQVCFSVKGIRKVRLVHQIIAIVFLDHIPNGRSIQVNHINENKLDNRIHNLEILTARENTTIASYHRRGGLPPGVNLLKTSSVNKYRARITFNGKKKNLGVFSTPEEASNAYQIALKSNQN